MSEELKPCPFCGEATLLDLDEVKTEKPYGFDGDEQWFGTAVVCSSCGSHARVACLADIATQERLSGKAAEDEEARLARSWWNTRPLEDAKDAEIARLKERVEWQPIDTFPLDNSEGEFMLLSNERCYSPCVFQKGGVISEDDFWIVWRVGDFDEVRNPTHWMPLPEPPAQSNKEG